jgi:RNA polymerase primary sigma factor
MKTNANKTVAAATFSSTRLSAAAVRPAVPARTHVAAVVGRAAPATGAQTRLKAVLPTRTEVAKKSAARTRSGTASTSVRGERAAAPAVRRAPAPAARSTREHARVRQSPAVPVRATGPQVATQTPAHAAHPGKETRSAPAVAPNPVASHTGRGDATLARYMNELAGYELLGREDEIKLAQEVERLEVAYWRALLDSPRAVAQLEPAVVSQLEAEAVPAELQAVVKAARAARPTQASKTARTRFARAADRAALKLREADLHRDAAKNAHRAAHAFADSPEAGRSRTGARSKSVISYLNEIDSARRAQQQAKDRFVAANLRLVVSMARRYAREGRMPLADLIQEGNLGLMKAVERFDHRRGFRFSTYASWWIRHALTRGLADKGRLVRLPVHALETRARLTRAARKVLCRTGVAPTLAELAAETGLAPEKLLAVEELSTEAPFSLDAPMGADNDRTFLDMLRYEDQTSAEDRVLSDSHKQNLASLLGELSPFEAQILRYRYGFEGGEERTLKEIGQMYNLSRERIRQIQASALAKMRARVEDAEPEHAML